MSSPTVLIIGGGIAGVMAMVGVRKHNKDANIVLVEPKEFGEILWASYRSPFDETTAKNSLYSLQDVCKKNNATHKRVYVTDLQETVAILSDGSELSFDVAIIAVGAKTKWDGMARGFDVGNDGTIQGRLAQLKKEGEDILASKSILIVGGGLVGAELAGDAAYHSKTNGSKVTLVHSGAFLCPDTNEKAGKMIQNQLEKSGVQVILNTRAEKKAEGIFMCGDEEVKADRVIMTVGLQPNNSFVKADACDEKGWVDADINLRVKGYNGRVFAVGDCCNVMPNNGKDILENGSVIGRNVQDTLKALANKTNLAALSLKKMKLGPNIAVCTTGPKSGVMHSALFNTSFIFPSMKNKTMFFSHARHILGVKPIEN